MNNAVSSLFSRWGESFQNTDLAGKVVQLTATIIVILLIPCCLCSIPVILVDTEDIPEPAKAAVVPDTVEDADSPESEIATSVAKTVEALPADIPATDTPLPDTPSPTSTTKSTSTSTATATSTSTATNTPTPTATPTPPYPEGELAEVVRIVDGDTIEVEMDGVTYPVRYIGINSPDRNDIYYEEASIANAELVEGQKVVLVKDVSETDRFDRLLRYVYLLDGTFVNSELVRHGFASSVSYPPDTLHNNDFLELQQEARDTSSGLWGLPTFTPVLLPTNTPAPLPTNTPAPLPTWTPAPLPTWTPAPPPTAAPEPTLPPPPPPTEAPAQNCHPSYQGACLLMGIGDYDCAKGSGDGPNYIQGPIQVVGWDDFRLDRDKDGVACE